MPDSGNANSFLEKTPSRILVVDDEADIRESLETLLELEGYLVELAVDGGDCLRKLDKSSYDLVLLDLSLPDGSGLELLPEVEALQPFATLVYVASASSGIQVARARALGATTFLFEPLTQSDIAARIGGSREMVSRIVRDLTAGNYIAVEAKRIRILKKLPAHW